MIAIRRALSAALRERTPCEDNSRSIGVQPLRASRIIAFCSPITNRFGPATAARKAALDLAADPRQAWTATPLAGLKIVRKRNHQTFLAGSFGATPSRAADLDDASGRALSA